MRLILVRHGESAANETRTHNSREEPLTARGHKQAQCVAERLRTEHIDRVICSNLPRAVDTAAAILKYHAGVPVAYDDRIREIDNGVFAGKPYGVRNIAADAMGIHVSGFRPENGENMLDRSHRVKLFLNELLDKPSNETVLIVAHGGSIADSLHTLTDEAQEYAKWSVRNTSITIVEVGESVRIHVLNDIGHVPKELQTHNT